MSGVVRWQSDEWADTMAVVRAITAVMELGAGDDRSKLLRSLGLVLEMSLNPPLIFAPSLGAAQPRSAAGAPDSGA